VGAIGNSLIYAGALARAGQVYDESITRAARRGNRLAVAWQSTMVSKAWLRLGDVRAAEADARLALELFKDGSGEPGLAWCAAHLLDALLARGAMAEADELVSSRISNPYCCDWRTAKALALEALGRRPEAVATAQEQLDDARRFGIAAATGVQRQFETVKAVQSHLRNIFRKLNVASREELPAALDLAS
jgi:ATP/maltotriose-dependent transcriptional regulator MalT